MVVIEPPELRAVGRLTRDGVLFGYLAIDEQRLSFSRRAGLRSRRWSETRFRYRLDLLDDWDEGFLDAEDLDNLHAGEFRFKGEVLAYEELRAVERQDIVAERFSDWA